jgi:hypothetical protein
VLLDHGGSPERSRRRRGRRGIALAAVGLLVIATATASRAPAPPPPAVPDGVRAPSPAFPKPGPRVEAGAPRLDLGSTARAGDDIRPAPTVDGPLPAAADRSAAQRRAHRLTRAFLHAFLCYETGRLASADARALRTTATPALAAALLARPPRVPHGRRAPRIASLERLSVYGPSSGRLKVIATLARVRSRHHLELRLRRLGGGWRIAALG